MFKLIIGIISDARIDEKFGKYSDFWKELIKGAVDEARKKNLEIRVFAPEETYNVIDFYSFAKKVFNCCDAVIMPFSQGSDDLIELLNNFDGPIVFVNTPPLQKWKDKLTRDIPYVGMNEFLAGEKIANILLEMKIKETLVIRHEARDEGHDQRVSGILSTGLKIKEIYINPETGEEEPLEATSALTLGTKGTLFALEQHIPTIVGIDCNAEVKVAFNDKKIKGILTQNPGEQGREAVNRLSSLLNMGDYLIEPKVYIN